jgi:hypothetical protein
MRSRARFVVVSWLASAGWLGCNVILGNESAVFAPELGDSSLADGTSDTDARVDATSDTGGDGTLPDATPCTDTKTNPRHCGACNHDCLDGECKAGLCQPKLLATEMGKLSGLVVDQTHLYWANVTNGNIVRLPIAGGTPEVVFDAHDAGGASNLIALHHDDVYFANASVDGGILRCPKSGCAAAGPDPIVTHVDLVNALSVTDSGVLTFGELTSGGRVGRCTLPCSGGFETISAGEGYPNFITSDGNDVAWSTLFPQTLRVKLGTSAPFTLDQQAGALFLVGNDIVFASIPKGPAVIPRDGGPVRFLTTNPTSTRYLVLDGTTTFFTDAKSGTGSVVRCSLSGCGDAGEPMAINQDTPSAIAVDAKRVYWINDIRIGLNDARGEVMTVAK